MAMSKKDLLDVYRNMKAHAEKELDRANNIEESLDGLNYIRRAQVSSWKSSVQVWQHAIEFAESYVPDDDVKLRAETLLKGVQVQLEMLYTMALQSLTELELAKITNSVMVIEKTINLIKTGRVDEG